MHAHLCTETRSWTTFNGYSSDGLKCWLWDPVFNVTLCKGWDKVHYSLDGCMLCVKCYCTHDTLCVINTDTVWIGRMLFVDIVWLEKDSVVNMWRTYTLYFSETLWTTNCEVQQQCANGNQRFNEYWLMV